MTKVKTYRQDGPAIRRIRQSQGIKPAQLAKLVEVTPCAIYGLEGEHRGASVELLHRIARVLEVPIDEITREAGSAA